MTDDDLDDIRDALAWLAEHVTRIPLHRRKHALTVIERVERMAGADDIGGDQ